MILALDGLQFLDIWYRCCRLKCTLKKGKGRENKKVGIVKRATMVTNLLIYESENKFLFSLFDLAAYVNSGCKEDFLNIMSPWHFLFAVYVMSYHFLYSLHDYQVLFLLFSVLFSFVILVTWSTKLFCTSLKFFSRIICGRYLESCFQWSIVSESNT